jgi:hypothetical protein
MKMKEIHGVYQFDFLPRTFILPKEAGALELAIL